jgi:CspA family cold shock protein
MQKGKVKWYNETKGFGFIESENGEDFFVHRTSITGMDGLLQTNQEVMFESKQDDKGPVAINVKLVE